MSKSDSRSFRDVLVIIPAWNEEEAISATLEALLDLEENYDVLLISDGSTDRTVEIASKFGIKILKIPFNIGVGGAIRAGYRFAFKNGYKKVVHFDSDLQHNPGDIKFLISQLKGTTLVIGSRFLLNSDYPMNAIRRGASLILCRFVSKRIKAPVTDVTSGFRATSGDIIKIFANKYPTEYLADTVESTLLAYNHGASIQEVGVTMSKRIAGKPSHGQFKSAVHFLRALSVILSTTNFGRK